MTRDLDCVVFGEVCVDLTVRPLDRQRPLSDQKMVRVQAIQPGTGGIVANSGMVLTRLGQRTAALACVGEDLWGELITARLSAAGVETAGVLVEPGCASSVTAVLVDEQGEHTFAFHAGASRRLDRRRILEHLPLFERSKFALLGYYGLLPELEEELPAILRQIQGAGCRTALDAAANGGLLSPLNRILPFLDIYVPSFAEAQSQTGQQDPVEMIRAYREFAPRALLGVKLGDAGVLLSDAAEQWIPICPVTPPGPVIDTTGAGDSFYAGLIAGLAAGLSASEAGRIGAATGACCVTAVGASSGIRDLPTTAELAGVRLM